MKKQWVVETPNAREQVRDQNGNSVKDSAGQPIYTKQTFTEKGRFDTDREAHLKQNEVNKTAPTGSRVREEWVE